MNGSGRLFEILWSIAAIGLGGSGFLCTDWYIDHTIRWANWFYEKTKFPLYKLQAKEMAKPYMRLNIKLIGLAFVVLGILLLLGKVHSGSQ